MPFVSITSAPSRASYDAVSRLLALETDPPPGLLMHTACEAGQRVRVVNVWESQNALDVFRSERLFPALSKVDATQAPENPELLEAFELVQPC